MRKTTKAFLWTAGLLWIASLITLIALMSASRSAPTLSSSKQKVETAAPADVEAPASIPMATADNSKTQLPKDQNKRFERCRANVKKAMGLDLIYDLRIDRYPAQVVVGPAFYEAPLDTKQVFADNVNCFLMAGDHKYMNFDLLDYRSGHVVAKYSYGKLKVM